MAVPISLPVIGLDPVLPNETGKEVCKKVSLVLRRYTENKLPLLFLCTFSYLDIRHEIKIINHIHIWPQNEAVLEWISFRNWQNGEMEAPQSHPTSKLDLIYPVKTVLFIV